MRKKVLFIGKKLLFRQITVISISTFMLIFSVSAQTKVVKRNALQGNSYGVSYYLPKTLLELRAHISKIETKAGPYYKYAEKYLGISNVVLDNKVYYELEGVEVFSKGVPDKNKSYLIELKSGTTAPFVYLTESGLICSINAEYSPEINEDINANKPIVQVDSKLSPESLFTEEYLQAGSIGKMAEIAAKQIYKIRESRMDILTGNSDNVPKDGEALKLILQHLEAQEKALMELFTGVTTIDKNFQTRTFDIEPKTDMEKEVIFRFSKHLGIVGSDDLSGFPVYMNLNKIERDDLNIDNTKNDNSKKKNSKDDKGVVYNIPGQGAVEVYCGANRIFQGRFEITQFGTTQILANPIFENKKAPVKVYFYPETGGIKNINQ